ncbi:hypothetical protein CYMTET_5459 [Cymbomonas tetramitiformis]|uniref:Uncharacterized protein n=1 Tax=Cymbomonas tetramitiformis TaxID=36881 RepID=A0AAE0GZE7_9CHLO|nr:hypothetical protein CYMTET_5459 [Cymbomonas tetramitiformis]
MDRGAGKPVAFDPQAQRRGRCRAATGVVVCNMVEMHSAPAMLHAGGSTAKVDLSTYGFAVRGAQEQGGADEMLGELEGIRGRLTSMTDAVWLSFVTTASIAGGEAGEPRRLR